MSLPEPRPASVFRVPEPAAVDLKVIDGLGMQAAANDDTGLRDRPPIVEEPGMFVTYKRGGMVLTGAVLMAVTVWLMARVFLLFAWLTGYRAFDYHFIALGGVEGVREAIFRFFSGIGVLGGSLIVWMLYNTWRFRGHDRRRSPLPITADVLAEHYALPQESMYVWQGSRWIRAHHDARGVVSGAEAKEATWIRPESEDHVIIKPNTFDILYLSARSRLMRKKARNEAQPK